MNLLTIKTPCVGICSTALGDEVCRGCKRYAHEVIDWNAYNYEQKLAIETRLSEFLSLVMHNKFDIVDEAKLKWQIEQQKVRVPEHRNLYCQAFVLLKAGAGSIQRLSDFGLCISKEWQNYPLKELIKMVDEDWYDLSNAHYQRYYEVI